MCIALNLVFAEEKTVSAECVRSLHEPVVQVPRQPGMPRCGSDQSTREEENGDEEEECEEEDEDTADFRAPIELLAEVRHLYTLYTFTLYQ